MASTFKNNCFSISFYVSLLFSNSGNSRTDLGRVESEFTKVASIKRILIPRFPRDNKQALCHTHNVNTREMKNRRVRGSSYYGYEFHGMKILACPFANQTWAVRGVENRKKNDRKDESDSLSYIILHALVVYKYCTHAYTITQTRAWGI